MKDALKIDPLKAQGSSTDLESFVVVGENKKAFGTL